MGKFSFNYKYLVKTKCKKMNQNLGRFKKNTLSLPPIKDICYYLTKM
jgi:hypothetical protein